MGQIWFCKGFSSGVAPVQSFVLIKIESHNWREEKKEGTFMFLVIPFCPLFIVTLLCNLKIYQVRDEVGQLELGFQELEGFFSILTLNK